MIEYIPIPGESLGQIVVESHSGDDSTTKVGRFTFAGGIPRSVETTSCNEQTFTFLG